MTIVQAAMEAAMAAAIDVDQNAQAVLRFWFDEHTAADWFGGAGAFDAEVRIGFAKTMLAAQRAETWSWRTTASGRLAEIIVLDQFTRQLYRGSARAFESDPMALVLAQELIASGGMESLLDDQRAFALMPFMHSESLAIHRAAAPYFARYSNKGTLDSEARHVDVLEKFGRYPKRNQALGRRSTAAELVYLADTEGRMF